MQVILVRHGDAGAYTLPDNERNLSELGKKQAKQIAEWIAKNFQPDHFIVSPYRRAMQTLSEITQLLPNIPVTVYDNITPDDDPVQAVDGLSEFVGDCIVVVCHMNIIAHIASILTNESPETFALAEARVLEMGMIAPNLAVETKRFIPNAM